MAVPPGDAPEGSRRPARSAPALYEHLGFRLVGVVEDWDSYGHTKHFYARDLASSD